jgi:hypothetical protein
MIGMASSSGYQRAASSRHTSRMAAGQNTTPCSIALLRIQVSIDGVLPEPTGFISRPEPAASIHLTSDSWKGRSLLPAGGLIGIWPPSASSRSASAFRTRPSSSASAQRLSSGPIFSRSPNVPRS